MRANGEYRRFLHIWSVGDDTDSRADEKHRRRKPYKSWCGTCLIARNPQNIFVAKENRKRRLLRQSNEFQSIEILDSPCSRICGQHPESPNVALRFYDSQPERRK